MHHIMPAELLTRLSARFHTREGRDREANYGGRWFFANLPHLQTSMVLSREGLLFSGEHTCKWTKYMQLYFYPFKSIQHLRFGQLKHRQRTCASREEEEWKLENGSADGKHRITVFIKWTSAEFNVGVSVYWERLHVFIHSMSHCWLTKIQDFLSLLFVFYSLL